VNKIHNKKESLGKKRFVSALICTWEEINYLIGRVLGVNTLIY